jgi:hypothetical protein
MSEGKTYDLVVIGSGTALARIAAIRTIAIKPPGSALYPPSQPPCQLNLVAPAPHEAKIARKDPGSWRNELLRAC